MKTINFMGNKKVFFGISIFLIVLIVAFIFINGVKLDIEFAGGSLVAYSYEGDLDRDAVAASIQSAIGEEVNIQDKEDVATGKKSIDVSLAASKSLSMDQLELLNNTMYEDYADYNIEFVSSSNVNPTIGREFFLKCIVAVIFAFILIVVFVAISFRKIGGWSAGVMAIIALLHDVIMVFGTFVILRFPLNGNFIAVVLTIIGYSVNDTIVVYDRIRENEKLYGADKDIASITNMSLNQVKARTINTSITTVGALVVICIVAIIYDISSIITFAVPMAVGMIAGAYSSLFLAAPMWVLWKQRKSKAVKPAKKNAVGKIKI